MVDRARGRGTRDGIDCTILETRLGSTGTVLETELPKARRCRPNVGNAPSGASTIESWTARTQEGFSRRRTFGKAAGGRRADPKFCARCRTAAMRTVTRRKYQLTRNKVRLQNQLEALLEEAHIKLSSLVSDLLGVSARRMLKAIADGGTDPAALAALADKKLRATQAQLCDALGACTELQPVYRRLLKMFLEESHLIEQQIGQLDQEMAALLSQHPESVQRLSEIPGLGV